MRATDRLLIGFVAVIVVLAGVALYLAANRPQPTYRASAAPEEAAPEDVMYNYLLALQREEYERAYAQLSPRLSGYPQELTTFISQTSGDTYQFPDGEGETFSFSVSPAYVMETVALVHAEYAIFSANGLFDSNRYTVEFQMELARVDGVWKIAGGERFFHRCWKDGDCS